jgi:hypothetical protein
MEPRILESISKIIGQTYGGGTTHEVGTATSAWTDRLPEIHRGDFRYAEPHMGAGEQKIIRLIQSLEALPRKSLILLEEPEIALHPDAQRGLAWYLMALSKRQGHQIVVSTHSSEIFETLPRQARIMLVRNSEGKVEVFHRVPQLAVARELSNYTRSNKEVIVVEDVLAASLVREILLRFNKKLLDNSAIVPIGSSNDVSRMVRSLRENGIRSVGARDPDVGETENLALLSLPGNTAPEAALISDDNIDRAERFVNGIRDAYERSRAHGIGFQGSKWAKRVFEVLPSEAGMDRDSLAERLTLAWLEANADAAQELSTRIENAMPIDANA